MPKPRPSRQSWDVRAAEILAGRGAADAGVLIDLIHEVNPTGRGRGADETSARYELKSRLQSVLVARFADDLVVTADPGDPGVASIRHRYKRHDACHAVIATLDDDARSWVQRELDVAASGGPESAPESEVPREEAGAPLDDDDLSAAQLLAAGEEAQSAYDYERAGRCFSRAVAASGGGVAAAVAYLSFTIDAMAADAEALAVEGRLPAATVADPRVGLLLGLAAARAGDEARALRLLGRAHDPRVAEVLVLLARQALAGGDADRAARHVRAAEAQDPAHPDLRALTDGIAVARAAERAPREAALAAHLAAGRDAEALAEAQAILARWPESEPARRASRHIEERQREGAGRRHLAEAEEALGRLDAALALDRLHRALACPLPAPERERALGRVREAEALAREQAERVQVDHVVALLAESDRPRALTAYVELDGGPRAAVRARAPLPALEWLEAIPSARPGGRVRAAVEAVLALARASSLAERDVAAAAALIAAHDRLLDDVPLARSIEARARAAAAEERARRATAELHEAEEALAGGHLLRARALFDKADLRPLPEGERARAAAFEAGLAAAEERQREIRHFERLRGAGAFRAARAAALTLAERYGAERERWTAEAAAIAEHARTRYAVKVDDLSGGPELLQNPNFLRVARHASAWVAEGGRELVVCNTEHAWGFLRYVDIDTGRVVRGVRFALDEPLNDPGATVHAEGVTIIGNSGLFEIDVARGEVVQRFDRNWNRDRGLTFGDGVQPRGTRLLWGGYGIDDEAAKIVDLDGEPAVKTFTEVGGPWGVVGATPPRLALRKTWYDEAKDRDGFTINVYEAGGAPVGRVQVRFGPSAIVAHPSGAGMVVLSTEYAGHDTSKVLLFEISDRFEVIAAPVIEEKSTTWPQPQPQIALSLDTGFVFVVMGRHAARHAILVALRNAGPGLPLIEHWRIPVPPRTTVAHDSAARRAFVVVDHPGGLAVAELGPEPPADLPESGPYHVLHGGFEHVNWCALHQGNQFIQVYVALRSLSVADRAAAIVAREEKAIADPKTLMDLFYGVLNGDWVEQAEGIVARAQALYPDDPGVRVAPFAILVTRRRWPELIEALDAAGPERFEGPLLQHYHHLQAVAHARVGDVEEARQHLTQAETIHQWLIGGHCSNGVNLLRQALETLPGGGDDLGFDRPVAAQLVAVLLAADARLADGDPAAAIAILERPLTWDLREVHSLSRLAAAYLAIDDASPAERFRKGLALATFIECVDGDYGGNRREGLAPGLGWTEARIDALRIQAIAWMDAEQGVPRATSWTA